MPIEKIEAYATAMVEFIRITAETGDFGWGQISAYNADITSLILHRQVAPHAGGEDASDVPALITRITELEHKFPESYLIRTLAGLDAAIRDLPGRLMELPVYSLIAGALETVHTCASSMKSDIKPEREIPRILDLAAKKGFDAFKIRIGSKYGHDLNEWLGKTEK